MHKIRELISQKPRVFVYASALYLVLIGLLKWVIHPSLDAVWFFVGGAIGIYFLDAAETFFVLHPSPFRSIVFGALFAAVSFFVVTSSTSTIGAGLVLSLYLQMLLWQVGEWRIAGNLNSWYHMISDPVPVPTQKTIFVVSIIIFLMETYVFIR